MIIKMKVSQLREHGAYYMEMKHKLPKMNKNMSPLFRYTKKCLLFLITLIRNFSLEVKVLNGLTRNIILLQWMLKHK